MMYVFLLAFKVTLQHNSLTHVVDLLGTLVTTSGAVDVKKLLAALHAQPDVLSFLVFPIHNRTTENYHPGDYT